MRTVITAHTRTTARTVSFFGIENARLVEDGQMEKTI